MCASICTSLPTHMYIPYPFLQRASYETVTPGFTSQAPFSSVMSYLLTSLTVDPDDGTATTCSTADGCVGEEGHRKTRWLSKLLLGMICIMLLVCCLTTASHKAMHALFK